MKRTTKTFKLDDEIWRKLKFHSVNRNCNMISLVEMYILKGINEDKKGKNNGINGNDK